LTISSPILNFSFIVSTVEHIFHCMLNLDMTMFSITKYCSATYCNLAQLKILLSTPHKALFYAVSDFSKREFFSFLQLTAT